MKKILIICLFTLSIILLGCNVYEFKEKYPDSLISRYIKSPDSEKDLKSLEDRDIQTSELNKNVKDTQEIPVQKNHSAKISETKNISGKESQINVKSEKNSVNKSTNNFQQNISKTEKKFVDESVLATNNIIESNYYNNKNYTEEKVKKFDIQLFDEKDFYTVEDKILLQIIIPEDNIYELNFYSVLNNKERKHKIDNDDKMVEILLSELNEDLVSNQINTVKFILKTETETESKTVYEKNIYIPYFYSTAKFGFNLKNANDTFYPIDTIELYPVEKIKIPDFKQIILSFNDNILTKNSDFNYSQNKIFISVNEIIPLYKSSRNIINIKIKTRNNNITISEQTFNLNIIPVNKILNFKEPQQTTYKFNNNERLNFNFTKDNGYLVMRINNQKITADNSIKFKDYKNYLLNGNNKIKISKYIDKQLKHLLVDEKIFEFKIYAKPENIKYNIYNDEVFLNNYNVSLLYDPDRNNITFKNKTDNNDFIEVIENILPHQESTEIEYDDIRILNMRNTFINDNINQKWIVNYLNHHIEYIDELSEYSRRLNFNYSQKIFNFSALLVYCNQSIKNNVYSRKSFYFWNGKTRRVVNLSSRKRGDIITFDVRYRREVMIELEYTYDPDKYFYFPDKITLYREITITKD